MLSVDGEQPTRRYLETRRRILEVAAIALREKGYYGARLVDIADAADMRTTSIYYYFPSKDDLVTEVLLSVGAALQDTLAPVFAAAAADHVELLRTAWPLLAQPDADPVFALFFEANGLAAAGRAPYATLVPQLVETWIAWTAEFLLGSEDERRVEAETTIAVLDGLLLLRQLAGAEAAERAARRLGIIDA